MWIISQGEYLTCLCENGNVVPIAQQSKKISRVMKSSLVSETLLLNKETDGG